MDSIAILTQGDKTHNSLLNGWKWVVDYDSYWTVGALDPDRLKVQASNGWKWTVKNDTGQEDDKWPEKVILSEKVKQDYLKGIKLGGQKIIFVILSICYGP